MIKIKWGRLITNPNHPSYVAYSVIGKIYGIHGSSVQRLIMKRFDELSENRYTFFICQRL